ncbi:hypothetical protein [Rufibacter sp. LB8]|uniref:hypothetical protein n=1 Tax=Rufibacter sp. LB8 TaxID=2777781 RepID=UPI00178C384A|nr:hypothetical protein [Rufibacter sp. LB8]
MNHIDRIKEICGQAAEPLIEVSRNGIKSYQTFEVDCKDLEDYNHIDIRDSEKFKETFSQLKKVTGPVLYWFEIISDIDNQAIIAELTKYINLGDYKSVPALKKTLNFDTRALYVGKVKTQFWGRLIQHLGYYKVKATQGLQLYYWAKNLPIKFKIHVYEFEKNMADLMPIVENALAKELKPLIGKHK